MHKQIGVKGERAEMNRQMVDNISEDPIQSEIEKLDELNRKQEERARNLEARAFQNVNLYFIFQGVILASTTMASSPKCHQWWIPFVVSLLAAVLNFFTLWSTMFKVLKFREELDQNLADLELIKLHRIARAQVNQVSQSAGNGIARPKPGSIPRWRRRLLVFSSIALFVGFTAVIMAGCYTILCRSNGEN